MPSSFYFKDFFNIIRDLMRSRSLWLVQIQNSKIQIFFNRPLFRPLPEFLVSFSFFSCNYTSLSFIWQLVHKLFLELIFINLLFFKLIESLTFINPIVDLHGINTRVIDSDHKGWYVFLMILSTAL